MFIQKNIQMKQGDALLRAISLHIVVRGELARFVLLQAEQHFLQQLSVRAVSFPLF